MSDVIHLRGIGKVFSQLLKKAGVRTVKELAASKPQALEVKLAKIKAKEKSVARLPSLKTVTSWTTLAKRAQKDSRALDAKSRSANKSTGLPGDETKLPK